jgi:flagellar motor switch protein FliM
MSDNLSKDEVDALLQGMHTGVVSVEGERPPWGAAVSYDLVAEDRPAVVAVEIGCDLGAGTALVAA